MMIAHASIPADNPEIAAAVLAEIMQGETIPFPPGGPGAVMAWSGDGETELEVVQRGSVIQYDEVQGNWGPSGEVHRHSEVHLAICVDRPESEIIAIAKKAGWPARHCERGGGYFSLVEVWVEGAFMIEFLDPQQTAVYKQRVTLANWKKRIAEMGLA
jgi:hypothetical protein